MLILIFILCSIIVQLTAKSGPSIFERFGQGIEDSYIEMRKTRIDIIALEIAKMRIQNDGGKS